MGMSVEDSACHFCMFWPLFTILLALFLKCKCTILGIYTCFISFVYSRFVHFAQEFFVPTKKSGHKNLRRARNVFLLVVKGKLEL